MHLQISQARKNHKINFSWEPSSLAIYKEYDYISSKFKKIIGFWNQNIHDKFERELRTF